MNRTLLVDGNGLCCRTWWASPYSVPDRFAATVRKIATAQACELPGIVAWDHASWRRTVFAGYKAGRKGKPQALKQALAECRKNGGIEIEGFEADDIIATLAWDALAAGGEVVILADDKDLAQLVSLRCWMVNAKGVEMREADVRTKFGVPPERIRHLLSWTGDATDGLPGVPGYGPKRAIGPTLEGRIGNVLTFELVGLARVPERKLTVVR